RNVTGVQTCALPIFFIVGETFLLHTFFLETAEECMQKKSFSHDKDGDAHYDVLSAFQKSIRGSDVDAALHYLGRLIEAGDLDSKIGRASCRESMKGR